MQGRNSEQNQGTINISLDPKWVVDTVAYFEFWKNVDMLAEIFEHS